MVGSECWVRQDHPPPSGFNAQGDKPCFQPSEPLFPLPLFVSWLEAKPR